MCCIDELLGSDKTNGKDDGRLLFKYGNMGKKKSIASLSISSKGKIDSWLKITPVYFFLFKKVMILIP